MIAPDLAFWWRLFSALAVEVCGLAALGFAAQWLARTAFWRRAVWQIIVVCLLAAAVSEWTGVGRVVGEHFGVWLRAPIAKPPDSNSNIGPWSLVNVPPSHINYGNATVDSYLPVLPLEVPPDVNVRRPIAVWWPGFIALAGTILLLARTGLAQGILFALRFGRNRITDGPLTERLARLLPRLGLRRKVSLRRMSALVSPMAFGIVRPSIGLPAQFEAKFSSAEQDAVLAHELAHLAARDPLWFLLADLAVAVLWWHPAAWWARQRLHVLAEQAADEATAFVPDGPKALAQCLVALGREMADMGAWGWVGVNGGGFRSKLGRRVETLLQLSGSPPLPSSGRGARAAKIAALLTAAPLTVLAFGSWQTTRESSGETWRSQLEESWRQSPVGVLLLARRDDPPPQNQPSQTEGVTPSTNQESKRPFWHYDERQEKKPGDETIYTAKLKLNYQNIRQQLAQLGLASTNTGMLQGQIRQFLTVVGVGGKEDGTSISFNDPLEEMEVQTHSSNDLKIVTETLKQLNRSPNKYPPSRNQNLDIAVRLKNSKFLYEMRKYDEAETMLRQIIKDDPSNRTAAYYLDLIKEARSTDPDRSRRPWVQGESGQFGDSMSIPPRKSPSLAKTNLSWNTNLDYAYKARQRIFSKLDSITLDQVSFVQLPLKEVLIRLRKESIARDPDGIGVNFMINTTAEQVGFPADSGAVPAAVPALQIDIGSEAIINISPPLHNLHLADVLDAITKAADKPIRFTVEDYAVVFTPKPVETNTLYTKRFLVNPNTFLNGLRKSFSGPSNVASTNNETSANNTIETHQLVRAYFAAAGVDLTPPKMIFWNDRLGEIIVRATEADLETIQRAIEILNCVEQKNESSISTQTANQPITEAGVVMVSGQVQKNFVQISPGKAKTLLEVVLESGPTRMADLRRVTLMHLNPTTDKWDQSVINVQAIEKDPAKDLPVQDHDRINVPERQF